MTSHLKQRIIIMITWIPLLSLNMKWERWMEHDDGCLHWNCDLWRVQVKDRVPPPFTLFSNQTIVNLSWSTTHSAYSSNSVTWIQQWHASDLKCTLIDLQHWYAVGPDICSVNNMLLARRHRLALIGVLLALLGCMALHVFKQHWSVC